jgi:hypothetical protein
MKFFDTILNKFKKPKSDLIFCDTMGKSWITNPPVRAIEIKPLKTHQMNVQNNYRFPVCPGMHDYSSYGYIVPAWAPIHIKANKAGTVVIVGPKVPTVSRATEFPQARPMEWAITEGTLNPKDVTKAIHIVPSPWKLVGGLGVSAILTAPYFHNSIFTDDIFVYPGIVDYNGFHTMNFVFSVRHECEVFIDEGDPLIHVLPIITERQFNASYKPANGPEEKYLFASKKVNTHNFYRKFYMVKKRFNLVPEIDPIEHGAKIEGKKTKKEK